MLCEFLCGARSAQAMTRKLRARALENDAVVVDGVLCVWCGRTVHASISWGHLSQCPRVCELFPERSVAPLPEAIPIPHLLLGQLLWDRDGGRVWLYSI